MPKVHPWIRPQVLKQKLQAARELRRLPPPPKIWKIVRGDKVGPPSLSLSLSIPPFSLYIHIALRAIYLSLSLCVCVCLLVVFSKRERKEWIRGEISLLFSLLSCSFVIPLYNGYVITHSRCSSSFETVQESAFFHRFYGRSFLSSVLRPVVIT